MARSALEQDSRLAEIEFLQQNLWGEQLISSTQKLLQDTRLQAEVE